MQDLHALIGRPVAPPITLSHSVDPVPPSPCCSETEHQHPSPSAEKEGGPLCSHHCKEQPCLLHEAQRVQPPSLGHPSCPESGVSLYQFPHSRVMDADLPTKIQQFVSQFCMYIRTYVRSFTCKHIVVFAWSFLSYLSCFTQARKRTCTWTTGLC